MFLRLYEKIIIKKQNDYNWLKWRDSIFIFEKIDSYFTVVVKKFGFTCIAGEIFWCIGGAIFCATIGQCGSIWLTFTSSEYNFDAGNTSFHVWRNANIFFRISSFTWNWRRGREVVWRRKKNTKIPMLQNYIENLIKRKKNKNKQIIYENRLVTLCVYVFI